MEWIILGPIVIAIVMLSSALFMMALGGVFIILQLLWRFLTGQPLKQPRKVRSAWDE